MKAERGRESERVTENMNDMFTWLNVCLCLTLTYYICLVRQTHGALWELWPIFLSDTRGSLWRDREVQERVIIFIMIMTVYLIQIKTHNRSLGIVLSKIIPSPWGSNTKSSQVRLSNPIQQGHFLCVANLQWELVCRDPTFEGGFLQHLHGVKLPRVRTCDFLHQEHLQQSQTECPVYRREKASESGAHRSLHLC